MDPHNPGQLRARLTQTVRPALDDFLAAPLDLQHGYTAMSTIYQYHEALFSSVTRTGKVSASSLADFHRILATESPAFAAIAAAVHSEASQTLRTTNILSGGGRLDAIAPVYRAVVVTKRCQQLIPLLETVMLLYGRLLDRYGL